MDEWLTVREVAKTLKVNPVTIRIWAREEKIKAKKYGRSWRIHRSVIEVA